MKCPTPLKRYLSLRRELEHHDEPLRFGQKCVRAADIANQYYCEKQVELRMLHGKEETEAMRIGRVGHEEAHRFATPVPKEKAWIEAFRQNRRRPYAIANFGLLCKHQGIFVAGVPDHAEFWKGKALLVRELKFRSKTAVYSSDFVQLRIYGYLMNQMGFDTSDLECEVICLHQRMREAAALYDLELPGGEKVFDERDQEVRRKSFDIDKAVKELDWALGFWRNERSAIPTAKSAKCRVCGARPQCPDSSA